MSTALETFAANYEQQKLVAREPLPPVAVAAIARSILTHLHETQTLIDDLRRNAELPKELEVSYAFLQYNMHHLRHHARELERGAKDGR